MTPNKVQQLVTVGALGGLVFWNSRSHAQPVGQAPVAREEAGAAALSSTATPSSQAAKRPVRRVSLSLSPVHLLLPIVELEAELMAAPHFGIAAIGGIGSLKASSSTPGVGDARFSAYESGLQLTGYPLRDFSSLQLGAEALWVKLSTESVGGRQVSASAGGLAIGPFVGYKLIADMGFTFFLQGGVQYMAVKGAASSGGASATVSQKSFIPLLNLNLGWSL